MEHKATKFYDSNVVLEKSPEEDEFEGTFFDTDFLEAIESRPLLLQKALKTIAPYCEFISVNGNYSKYQIKPKSPDNHLPNTEWAKQSPIFRSFYNQNATNGWEMNSCGGVCVYQFQSKNLEEVKISRFNILGHLHRVVLYFENFRYFVSQFRRLRLQRTPDYTLGYSVEESFSWG